jgi:hypothetical protein
VTKGRISHRGKALRQMIAWLRGHAHVMRGSPVEGPA